MLRRSGIASLSAAVVVISLQRGFDQALPAPPHADSRPQTDAIGDPLPKHCVGRLGTTRLCDPSGANCIAFAPDGKVLASGGHRAIRLWEIASGNQILCFDDLEFGIHALAFSHDGRTLASGDDFMLPRIFVHDVVAKKQLHILNTDESVGVGALAFSDDDKTLGAVLADRIGSWDIASGEARGETKLQAEDRHGRYHLASVDGKSMAVCDKKGVVNLFDVKTGKPSLELTGHTDFVECLALSANGKMLATGSWDKSVRIWDLAAGGKQRKVLDNSDRVRSVAFCPDGKLLATMTDDGTTRLWDVATGEVRHRFPGQRFSSQVAFSPDGKLLARAGSRIAIWDVDSGKALHPSPGHSAEVFAVAVSPDDNIIASTGADLTIRVWNQGDGKEVRCIALGDEAILSRSSALISADGKSLIWAVDRTVHIADVTTGANERRLDAGGDVNCIAVSPCHSFLAISREKEIQIWNYETGKRLMTLKDGFRSFQRMLSFAPDGQTLFAASIYGDNHEAQLWDLRSSKMVHKFEDDEKKLCVAAFSPDGQQVATVGLDKRFCIWSSRSGKKLRSFPATAARVSALCFSPDGKTLATAGDTGDGKIRLWELATGDLRAEFAGHHSVVECLVYSHDGRRLISGSTDSTCLIWDVTGQSSPIGLNSPRISADQWDSLWAGLANGDAVAAYEAMWKLIAAEETVKRLAARLAPIRALDEKECASLAANLDHEDFAVRQRATNDLRRSIESATPALRRALAQEQSLEVRARIEDLLKAADDLPPEHLQLWRATELLEHIGTPEARKALRILAEGFAESRITREAKAALQRLATRDAESSDVGR